MVSSIILAAGLSSRMGIANKLLLTYKGKTVIEYVAEAILNAGIAEVIMVTGHEAAELQAAVKKLPIVLAHNTNYDQGITSSIQQGTRSATGTGYMICLSDMVTITSAEYRELVVFFEATFLQDEKCICLPVYKNQRGNPVIFSSYYKEALLLNNEQEGCRNIVQFNKEHVYLKEMNMPHVLQDFDYMEDFKKIAGV